MRQRAYYTYPLDEKLMHTSMWLRPSTLEWLRNASVSAGMSQALLIDTLVRDYRLRQMESEKTLKTVKRHFTEQQERDDLNAILHLIPR